jgi:hypothetical protein
MTNEVIVRKNSYGTYDVYVNGTLVEGGFFNRAYAEKAAARIRSRA